jgi:hypothetical protein
VAVGDDLHLRYVPQAAEALVEVEEDHAAGKVRGERGLSNSARSVQQDAVASC